MSSKVLWVVEELDGGDWCVAAFYRIRREARQDAQRWRFLGSRTRVRAYVPREER